MMLQQKQHEVPVVVPTRSGSSGCRRSSSARRGTAATTSITCLLLLLLLLGGSTLTTMTSGVGVVSAAPTTTSTSTTTAFFSASATNLLDLPSEFSIRPATMGGGSTSSTSSSSSAPSGLPELVWDPIAATVRVGGSRYEFRLGSDTLLGYPMESIDRAQGKLVLALPLTGPALGQLHSAAGGNGQYLQVWSSGRRLDAGAPAPTASPTNVAPTPSPSSLGSSNSTTLDPSNVTTVTSTNTAATVAGGTSQVLKVKAAPTVSINPAAVGPYKVRRRSYNLLPGLNITDYPVPLEVLAEVTYPKDLEVASSSLKSAPLVLFLHGRHWTCYSSRNGDITGDWPCLTNYTSVPSYQGYRYVANILASQGYVAVSISANAINAQDGAIADAGAAARSILIRHHLDLWSTWNAVGGSKDPWTGNLFRNKLDMTKVVLVGHSRGGEGVNRAGIDATSGASTYKIVGLVSYGPTAFGRQVNPDLHSATLLPTCDGDVSDLQGQAYVDSSRDVVASLTALRSAVIVIGANHNYFNTEWTPELSVGPSYDDWYDETDPVCGTDAGAYRLTPQEQQMVGAAYTLALVRLAVKQDSDMLQLLDGSFVRPQSIGRANVVTHAVGGTGSRLLYIAQTPNKPLLGKGMQGNECQGYPSGGSSSGLPTCTSSDDNYKSPHFLFWWELPTRPAPQALLLKWNQDGAIARFKIGKSQRDFRSLDSVDIRVANDPDRDEGSRLEMWLMDGRSRIVKLDTSLDSIEGWPGTYGLDRIHARGLRGRLDSVDPKTEFNLKNVTQVMLIGRGDSGKVWVLDVSATQHQVGIVSDLNLPVVSAELLSVPEGDGPNSAKVKVTSDRPFTKAGSIWVEKAGTGFMVPIPAGTNQVVREFTFSWTGDSLYSPYPLYNTALSIGAVTGAVIGNYIGGLDVVEDDTKPNITAVANDVTVTEGQDLVWNFELSAPVTNLYLYCYVVPPSASELSNRTELSTADFPRQWIKKVTGSPPPSVPVPISDLYVDMYVDFAPSVLVANLTIPTLKDGVTEPKDEVVSVECTDFDFVESLKLTGVVLAS